MSRHYERVGTVAFIFTTGALVIKKSDILTNTLIKDLISLFIYYITSVINTGNFSFACIHGKSINLNLKQHIHMQMVFLRLLLGSLGCSLMVMCFIKKLIKRYKNFLKKSIKIIKNLRFKRSNNAKIKLVQCIEIR